MAQVFPARALWRVTRADWSEFVERTRRFGPPEREHWNREQEALAEALKKAPLAQWNALRDASLARVVPEPRVWLRHRGRAQGTQSVGVENHLVQLLLTGTRESAFGVFTGPWEGLEIECSMAPGRTWLARLWPTALCALTVLLMSHDWLSDPYNPALEGRARYGHNHEGALWQMALWVLGEWAVLQGVLRPGGKGREVWRAALALLLLVPWTFFSMFMAMHAGGIVALHVLWLMAADLGVLGVLVSRGVRRMKQKAPESSDPEA